MERGRGRKHNRGSRDNARAAGGDENSSASKGRHGDLQVERRIPKFLQPYAHLLERGAGRAKRPAGQDGPPSEDEHDDGNAESIAKALKEDPELRQGVNENEVKRINAKAFQEQGNEAFKSKDFVGAERLYTLAIAADHVDAVLYSNRSAARAQLQLWDGALEDAVTCVNLRAGWAKGWLRLGNAQTGLKQWAEAKDAFAKAIELEPDDHTIQALFAKADYEERQASRDHRYTFTARACPRRDEHGGPGHAPRARAEEAALGRGTRARPPRQKRRLLSLDEEEAEAAEEEEEAGAAGGASGAGAEAR